jgi:DNA polymerase sigma
MQSWRLKVNEKELMIKKLQDEDSDLLTVELYLTEQTLAILQKRKAIREAIEKLEGVGRAK